MTDGASGALVTAQALRRFDLTVTRRLDGLLQGSYQGLLPGPGSDPAEAREYQPGYDDVRRMEWNVTARTNVPHVRDLVADRELETWVVVDATASMDFGTADHEKRDLAAAAVAAVGTLTTGPGNRLGAVILAGGGTRRLPARGGRAHLLSVLRTLYALPRTAAGPQGPSLAAALQATNAVARRRGLVVVLSDFLDGLDPDGGPPAWERPFRTLGARHQLLAVDVTDPREHALPDVGILTLVDPESGRRLEVSTSNRRVRERYAAAAAEQRGAIAAAIRRTGAAHVPLRTDRDWVRDIARFVLAHRRTAHLAAHRSGRSS